MAMDCATASTTEAQAAVRRSEKRRLARQALEGKLQAAYAYIRRLELQLAQRHTLRADTSQRVASSPVMNVLPKQLVHF